MKSNDDTPLDPFYAAQRSARMRLMFDAQQARHVGMDAVGWLIDMQEHPDVLLQPEERRERIMLAIATLVWTGMIGGS